MSEVIIRADVAEKMAGFVNAATPVLERVETLNAGIPRAVDVLVSKGEVLADARDIKVAEFIEHPDRLLAALAKVATAQPLGAPADPPGRPAVKGKSKADLAYEAAILG